MNLWLVLGINSVTLGGLLFLLSAGFSLIFGLMRIPNLTHGSFFMLGAYFAMSLMRSASTSGRPPSSPDSGSPSSAASSSASSCAAWPAPSSRRCS